MDVNLEDRRAVDDPAGFFAEARARGGDVQWSEHHRAWLVLSHAAVEAGFRDTENLSADRMSAFARVAATRSEEFGRVVELLSGWMNFRDDPAHHRLREPVKGAFTPRRVEGFEAKITALTNEVIDAFPGDHVDLVRDFARIVPALVIAAILGVEGEERHRFQAWSDDIAHLVFSLNPGNVDEGPILGAAAEFTEFFSRHIERERTHPTGSLLTTVVQDSSSDLSALELVGACTIILFGGHETTTTLLSNSLVLLMQRTELQQWLREHPEADRTAPDEFLRIGGPSRALPRKVARDHVREGKELKAGQNVYLCVAAANHDPAVFAAPGEVDLLRDPNPHMGFGWGPHYCLGANLGRLEARIAIRALLDRVKHFEPDGPIPEVRASAMGFGRRPLKARIVRKAW
jgi:cytochrome P450